MKTYVLFFFLALFLPCTLVGSPLLTEGVKKATLYRIGLPAEIEGIGNRMMAHVQSDEGLKAHFMTYAQAGKPVPYDMRMGISAEQYKKFIEAQSQIALIKVDSADLELKALGGSRFNFISRSPALSSLNGVEIDLKKHIVETKFGRTQAHSEIELTEGPFAPFKGFQYNLQALDQASQTAIAINFHVGKGEGEGERVVYYRAKGMVGGEDVSERLILKFRSVGD